MIDKSTVEKLVNQWLEGKEYFLTDLTVSTDDRIVVEIDHEEGVWIEDCVELSRFIEEHLSRDEQDYELEVGSAGIGQPFKVMQQYINHVGMKVETVTLDGQKQVGILKEVSPEQIVLTVTRKVKEEGMKRPQMRDEDVVIPFEQIKKTQYVIDFK